MNTCVCIVFLLTDVSLKKVRPYTFTYYFMLLLFCYNVLCTEFRLIKKIFFNYSLIKVGKHSNGNEITSTNILKTSALNELKFTIDGAPNAQVAKQTKYSLLMNYLITNRIRQKEYLIFLRQIRPGRWLQLIT